jgi:hypothetical protein
LEAPGCDENVVAVLEGDAAARLAAYHDAFAHKCGSLLMGDSITGVFTGTFVRRMTRTPLTNFPPRATNWFVITEIETSDLDPASITCAKG